MSEVSTPPSSPPRYTPPPELVTRAEEALRRASPAALERAAACYELYGSVTGGRSAVTGADLPRFENCFPLVRAGWLEVGDAALRCGLAAMRRISDGEGEVQVDEAQVDPFLLGLGDIAAAAKSLAEASRIAAASPHNEALGELISTITSALHTRVKALAPPADP